MTPKPPNERRSPYRVDCVDQFEGHDEDGYATVGSYGSPEEAIAVARRITEDAIGHCGSVEAWEGMGDAGLVYDATGKLVWDGVEEYRRTTPITKEGNDHGT